MIRSITTSCVSINSFSHKFKAKGFDERKMACVCGQRNKMKREVCLQCGKPQAFWHPLAVPLRATQ